MESRKEVSTGKLIASYSGSTSTSFLNRKKKNQDTLAEISIKKIKG